MNEPFRTRTAEPTGEEPKELHSDQKSDDLQGNETPTRNPLTEEEKTLDIWEGLNNCKYLSDYFKIKAYEGEFSLKMQTSQIDKYIRAELETRGYEKNIDNYKKVLQEIESEIGSDRLETFKRITKITGYIRALKRLNEAKKRKELYKAYRQEFEDSMD